MRQITILKKDLKIYFLFIFLIFPFFRFTYLTFNFPLINKLYILWQIISFLGILICYFKRKETYISNIIIHIIIYLLILNFSTIINKASLIDCLYLSFKILTLSLVVEYGIKFHKKIFIKTTANYLKMLVIINFISILFNPSGMYIDNIGYHQNWLLGYKNIHILFIIPAIMFDFIYSYYYENKLNIKNYIFLIISYISIILVDSSTSLIGLTIILIFVILNKIFIKLKILNIKTYFATTIIAFFSLIIFRIQNYFQYFIVNILHRNINFTNRTYIWDYVISFIKNKPLLGYGVENSFVRYNKTLYYQSFHAHNQILEIIYKSGFIGLISFIIIIIMSIRQLYENKDNIISKMLSIILFSYFVMMLTEVYSYEYFIFILVVCYNIKNLVKESEK